MFSPYRVFLGFPAFAGGDACDLFEGSAEGAVRNIPHLLGNITDLPVRSADHFLGLFDPEPLLDLLQIVQRNLILFRQGGYAIP